MKRFMTEILLVSVMLLLPSVASALSETVRMKVGETRTLAPAELPSLVLAGQPSWTSSRPGDVQITSWDMYTCRIKALKSFSGYARIQCKYYYRRLDPSGQYIGQGQGAVNYNVFVESVDPESVTVYPVSITLDIGDTYMMQVSVYPPEADQTVTWSSTDWTIASVNSSNVLGANRGGTATVTAKTVNGRTASCTVTVRPRALPSSVSIQPSLALTEGQSATLTPEVTPSGAGTNFTWVSDNTAVATVSSSGRVTGISPGTATVTVTTSNGKYDTCVVTVKNKPGQPQRVSLPETLDLVSGFSTTLSPELYPEDSQTTFTWDSSDPSVVGVSTSGRLTAKSEGESVITVRTGNGLEAECRVTVRASDPDLPISVLEEALARIRELEEWTVDQY